MIPTNTIRWCGPPEKHAFVSALYVFGVHHQDATPVAWMSFDTLGFWLEYLRRLPEVVSPPRPTPDGRGSACLLGVEIRVHDDLELGAVLFEAAP